MTSRGALSEILQHVDANQPIVRLVIVKTEGSAPRELGAAMLVDQSKSIGTIGGGQLEFEAIAHARKLIVQADTQPGDWPRDLRTWPLGPALGQCCGGTVRLLFELYGPKEIESIASLESKFDTDGNARSVLIHPTLSGEPVSVCAAHQDTCAQPLPLTGVVRDMLTGTHPSASSFLTQARSERSYFIEPLTSPATPLFIFGAGHVGQAIVKTLSDLEFDVHWIDTHAERFPQGTAANVQRIIARDPTILARAAPDGAFHLVLTYSHALDLAICHALMAKPTFGFLGLIGSQTKRTRFLKRLREAGVTELALSRLTCPIGIGQLRGKAPATIAVSIVAQLIECQERSRDRIDSRAEGEHGTSQRIPA